MQLSLLSFILLLGLGFSSNWIAIESQTETEAKVEMLNSDIEKTILDFSVEGFNLVKVETPSGVSHYVDVEKGTPMLSKGNPNLQKLTESIIIPDNAEMSFKVISSEFVDFENVDIAPSKGSITRNIDPNSIDFEYSSAYDKDEFFPGELVSLRDPFVLRDYSGQVVVAYPFQYNPKKKTLRVYTNITVEVYNNSSSGNGTLSFNNSEKKIVSEYRRIYEKQFINFEQSRYDVLSEQGNMLVICNDAFLNDMQPFVDWKNMKGIPTEMVSLSEVGSSSSSIDNYVSNYYYEQGLTFLLLVGDISQMPSITISGTASDPSYGYIEGNDYYPEIMVGRFSAESSSHVQTQVNRTINYERYPSSGVGSFKYGVGIASNEGQGIGDEGEGDWEHLDIIRQKLMNFTYNDLDQIYGTNGGSASDVTYAVNEGRSIINYTGHGSNTSWGTTGFSNSNVDALTNTHVWPYILSVACVNGAFDQGTCFAEAWLRATHNGQPSGAVVMSASTVNQQWAQPMEGQDEFNDILIESYNNNIKRTYGGLFYNGCMKMVDSYGSSGESESSYWHLFGDPSLLVRTDDPTSISPVYDPTILIGQTEFAVDTGDSGSLVALSKNGVLLSSGYSNGGVAVLELGNAANTPGELSLVVSSFNSYAYEASVMVIAPEGPYVINGGFEIVSDSNGNGMVNNGETVGLSLTAENVGVESANNVVGNISCSDPYVSVSGSSNTSFGNIAAGGISNSSSFVEFDIDYSTPDGHNAQIIISYSSNTDSWESSFSLTIQAPEIVFSNAEFEDSNGDGIWDAGETAEVTVYISNLGSGDHMDSPGAHLEEIFDSWNGSVVSILEDETYIPTLLSGQSSVLSFTVQANDDVDLGTPVNFMASFVQDDQNGAVSVDNYSFSMVIGHPTMLIWDPEGGLSGERLSQFFEQSGRTGYDHVVGNLASTEYYTTAFVFLGIYYDPNNHVLQQNEADAFVEILNRGGSVYMEGGDTWAYDSQTSLHGMFGLTGVSDGTSDLNNLEGVEGTFTEGLEFDYNGGNSWIDHIAPAGGVAILNNNSAGYTTAIAYQGEGYRTVGASHELGGLTGDDFPTYIEGLLSFLETGGIDPVDCTVGDLNEDSEINILDIVLQVNIIIGTETNPTSYAECAADINADGVIDVLDIILNINLITQGNGLQRAHQRTDAVSSFANIELDGNNVSIMTDGRISGVQLVVSSEGTITFNRDLNMNMVSNEDEGLHTILVYHLENFIEPGLNKLFTVDGSFEVVDAKVVNSESKYVDVQIANIIPEKFILNNIYPNPFNPSTSISVSVPEYSNLVVEMYNLRGRLVKSLYNGSINEGSHTFIWNGSNMNGQQVPAGMYICRAKSSGSVVTKKVTLLK